MNVFPVGFPLQGRRVAVVGDGEAAEAKARLFLGSPAQLVRVAADDALDARSYTGVSLAFIALPGEAAVEAAAVARSAGALVNVVDRPELCDFNTPAIVDRGDVVGAIMTGGAAPVLSTELRLALEAQWPMALGQLAVLLERIKDQARTHLPDPALRRGVLRALIRGPAGAAALDDRMAEAEALACAALADARPPEPGIVLVHAPEAPDLMTLRTLRLLSEADRIVIDADVDPALARLARRDAPLTALDPGETLAVRSDPSIARAWLSDARLVVRICSTDPQIECAALVATGVKAEISQ